MLGRCRLIALLLPLLCHSHSLADASATASKGVYVLENETMRLEVEAASGARIRSWRLLPSGREMISLWQSGTEIGGALDDRPYFTTAAYDGAILQPGPATAVVRFTAIHAPGLKLTKTLSLSRGSPTLGVRYEYSNGTQASQPLAVRSFLLPGTRPPTEGHAYWVNTPDAHIAGGPAPEGLYAAGDPATAAVWDRDTGDGVLLYAPGAGSFGFRREQDLHLGMEITYARVAAGKALTTDLSFTCVGVTGGAPSWGTLLAKEAANTAGGRSTDLPGWENEATRFRILAAERKKGFWLSIGGPGCKQRLPGPLEMDLPLESSRYVAVAINALAEWNAPVRLDLPDQWQDAVRGYWETPGKDRRELVALSRGALSMVNGSANNLWLEIDSSGTPAGDYDIPLRLSVGKAEIDVPIRLKVWPVSESEHRPFNVRGYSGGFPTWAGGYEVSDDGLRQLEAILRTYREMGGNVLDWTCNWSRIIAKTRIAGTEQGVADAVKTDPERMDPANPPDLDFSYYDPWFELARRYGVTRLDTYMMYSTDGRWGSYLLNPALGAGKVSVGTPEADRVIVWFFEQMRRHLEAQGMTGMFCKIADEIAPEDMPRYIETAQLARSAGWRPFTTITGMISRTADYINRMNPHCDQWQLAFSLGGGFDALRTTGMRLSEEQAELTGPWKRYSNGGAQNTWAITAFGPKSALGVTPDQVESFVLLEDGRPMQPKGRSPWGNKDRGVVITAGSLREVLYLSPSDDRPPEKHRYVLEATVRRNDPAGVPLVTLEPTDEVWTYGGAAKPFRADFDQGYIYPIVTLHQKLDGYGQWAFYHWNATERIIWVDDRAQVTVSPVYCGFRDGWRDCLIFSQLPRTQLDRIVGTAEGCSLRVEPADKGSSHWAKVVHADNPVAINRARARALEALSSP